MGRSPCCDKIGLKKGPWAAEEDQILTDYIRRNGHGNWRALPKQAGLLRCGKSCRLRWTNYLRPDLKRGNFSQEEEDTIIKLHQTLGNRWSAIAARLPGRTDNEIKNVWHTHLKKKLNNDSNTANYATSPQHSSFSINETSTSTAEISTVSLISADPVAEISQNSWSDPSEQEGETMSQFTDIGYPQFDHHRIETPKATEELGYPYKHSYNDDNMDFWFHIYVNAGNLTQLPAF